MTCEQFFRLGVTSATQLKINKGFDFNLFVANDKIKSKKLSEFGLTEFKDIDDNDRTHLFNAIQNSESDSRIETLNTRQFRVYSRINNVSDLIHVQSNHIPNIGIVNVQVASILRSINNKLNVICDNTYTIGNCKYIGHIDHIAIYVDPDMQYDDTRIALGIYKGEDNTFLYNESCFFTFAINIS